jgi:lysophospholipase L1-like esterase
MNLNVGINLLDQRPFGKFDPTKIAPMSVWFDADSLKLADGAVVSTWEDKSGNGRNFQVTNGTPTYKANGAGGKGALVLPTNARMQTPAYQQFPSLGGTVIMVSTPIVNAANKQLLGTFNQTSPNWLWYQTNGTVNKGFMGGTFFNSRGGADRVGRPSLQAWVRNGASLTVYDGASFFVQPTVSNTQQSNVRLLLGDSGNGASAEISCILVFPSILNNSQIEKVFAGIGKQYLGGVPVHVSCCGDSITAGFTPGATPYPTQLENKIGFRFGIYNLGVSGDGIASCVSRATTGADVYAARSRGKSVFIGFVGTNDINGGMSGSDAYTAYRQMFLNRPHTKKVAVTMLNRIEFNSSPTKAANRALFNSLVETNWRDFADSLARPELVPELSDCTNATYFPDGVHLSTSGYDFLSTCIGNSVTSLNI